MTLKRKNAILLSAISVTLLAISHMLITQAASYAEKTEAAHYQQSVEQVRAEIDHFLQERLSDMQVLTTSLSVQLNGKKAIPSSSTSLTDVINAYVMGYQTYQNVALFSSKGSIVNQSTVSYDQTIVKPLINVPKFASQLNWFKTTLANNSEGKNNLNAFQVKGNEIYASVTNKNDRILLLTTKVTDSRERAIGVLVATVDIELFERLISTHYQKVGRRLSSPLTGIVSNHAEIQTYAVAPQGFDGDQEKIENAINQVLTMSNKGQIQSGSYYSGAYLISWASNHGVSEASGTPRLFISILPKLEVFAHINTAQWYAILLALGLVFILSFGGFMFISRIGGPLQEVEQVISSLARDELEVKLPDYKTNDEILRIINALGVYKQQLIERNGLFERIQYQKQELDIQFRAIEAANASILVLDAQTEGFPIVYANKAMCKLYGKSEGAIKSSPLIELYDVNLNLIQVEEIKQALENEMLLETTVSFLGADNQITYWELYLSPVYNDNGVLLNFLLIHNDVTKLRRAEEETKDANRKLEDLLTRTALELEGSEHQMNAIFQSAVDGMLLVDADEKIIDINETAQRIFGWDKVDIVGSLFDSLISEEFNVEQVNYLKEAGQVHNGTISERIREAIGVSKGGNLIPLDVLVTKLTFADKEIYFVTFRDISDRKQVESELKYSKRSLQETIRRFNLATEAGDIGIWNWNFVTDSMEWDDRMYHMYKVSPDSSKNTYEMWRQCLLEEDVEQTEIALTEAKNSLTRFFSEFRIRWPNGEIRWIKASADVIFEENSGVPIGMGGVNLDVTEEKNAQELLRRESADANAANEAKSLFLANMSHEIRTPMNGVVGMIDLLSETELSADQKSMATTIRDSSLHLLSIINDILDISKIEAHQMSVEHLPVVFQDTVEKTVDVLWLQANQNYTSFYLVYDPLIPNRIVSDSVRLGQVLLNIIGNAVKFAKGTEQTQGEIWVRAVLVENVAQPYIEITVNDNGIGMSEEQISQLFKSFSQGDASTTRIYGGTGLGLAISRSLVEMMGGEINVESEQWLGTTFTIKLPCDIEGLEEELTAESVAGTSVVTVIGDSALQKMVSENLELNRCKVLSLNSIEKLAMFLAAQNEADVIILGPEYSIQDKQTVLDEVGHSVAPFVLLSNEPTIKLKLSSDDCLQLGIKPLKPSYLINSLLIVLGKRSPLIEEVMDSEPDNLSDSGKDHSYWRILVAEDQPTNRDVIERQLSRLGYSCVMAENGAKALEKWKKNDIDLIISDCHMPVMDGFELAKAIREFEQNSQDQRHTPILALTANALVGSAEQCFEAGMDDYLSKPVDLSKLKLALERWLADSPPEMVDIAGATPRIEVAAKPISKAPICFEKLEDILGTSDIEVLAPLLEAYWDSIQNDIDKLQTAQENRDRESLRQAAHAAKGAALSAGAEPLGEVFKSLETQALEEEWNQLELRFSDALTCIEEIKTLLEERAIIAKGAA